MSYLYFAFFMGLFGSIHCAVMCGPLLLAIQGSQELTWKIALNKLFYQVGRILTYGIFGIVLGLVGKIASIQGWQMGLSLFTGIILLIIGLVQLFKIKNEGFIKLQMRFVQPIAKIMGRWLYRPGGSFFAGVLNGILPCGMLYMAAAAAMNTSSSLTSFYFMIMFGLGTLPLLLVFSFLGNFIRTYFKMNFSKWLPFLYILMGIWFLLRGANLDIPYLSPLLHVDGAINCHIT
ncbi:sulfite exporter TauE/SafE family protein [Sphingobacterium faecium]|jgi:sulfite exporter TauE/SafE|uniref:sulfite exporter TauE/SafE family protein n=1 Tax=Sphingobacterium faecium TaxID=34087 RepID=UPI00097EA3ED|nr:sulfite exporter TauE/SafE family protein [Sphingobacterium faecium]UXD68227.1 sulfite exporter TauE/SafE family protein [Sphingobacterium faecium]SJN48984.1 Heavy-metal-associated domain (N-terminus) and membrane-bounded cytochrome biogenesis cycZ-like domain, possible membrane copper tolerance protein [Sphingobacterium faecium PCAi_F2.5]